MFSSNTSQVVATATAAEAVDFDGTNDYLSRSSDLTGNTSGKTFTFSGWVCGYSTSNTFYCAGPGSEFIILCDNSSGFMRFRVLGVDNLGNSVLNVQIATGLVPSFTWTNITMSIDLTNTARRFVYVNDVQMSPTWIDFQNVDLNRQFTTYKIGYNPSSGLYSKSRMSHIYLDYTYRDLSITANRRLFVTADLKPAAGQAALNPIIYFKMNDPTTVATNSGTGGNFTLTGTVARSGRGPNQYNAPYSALDGSLQYLSKTSITGIADGKQLTVSFCANINTFTTGNVLAFSTTSYFRVYFGSNAINITALNAAGSTILSASYSIGSAVNRNYSIQISCDLSDTSKRHMIVNGQAVAATWSTYTDDNIDFTHTTYQVGRYSTNQYLNGRLGAIWFNTSYIDLSVASNLAKFVSGTGIDAKPVDLGATGELPTGTAPLIYLPMYGGNAGKNYGTGGDFTVNSGVYTGARGPNEFWGNKANFGATTSNYLSRSTALVGNPGSVTTATFCCYFYCNNAATTGTLFGFNSAASGTWQISANRVFVWLGSGTVEFNENVTSSAWHSLLFSRTGSTITAYLDGVALTINSGSSFDYGGAIQFAQTPVNIGVRNSGSSRTDPMNGQISELYLSSSYIDFSQEANRLKFRDCFGNPVDLSAQITAQSIPTPIVYARFPPTAFGTNSGTGGDFTVSGTITDGGQL